MNIQALIVWLGQIGMGYDYHCSADDFIATHARALYLHPDFELVGGVDSSLQLLVPCQVFLLWVYTQWGF